MFETSIAGSLPKPAWLAETNKLWPQWQIEGDALLQAKADATLLWIKAQEDAGLDIVSDGEQSRQHFVHGFLEQIDGIDFEHKVKMGIRDNRYDAMVPQVVWVSVIHRHQVLMMGRPKALMMEGKRCSSPDFPRGLPAVSSQLQANSVAASTAAVPKRQWMEQERDRSG